ncbi:heme NO-binding domain-containing protein [Glaciimonas sp. CA11.2]|uniref:heme NO-binding domain-containing protein n=1 Tax=Glaciimonas sp. CA11.2 TaxID=3048601 RepID=UPI002AB44406|nr:heme NO-binding domain-containing protein [Glaciimonas sp. CA11.2]MDY7548198.1 heme NO-binding domain-containing protein [Glaciimonas sp. CA11.2]
MKGIIFQTFIHMMEKTFSIEMADEVMSAATLETGGAYTTVGTYKYPEIIEMVGHLSERTGVPVPTLLCAFGKDLFTSFTRSNINHLENVNSTFSLLKVLDNKIHVDVKKLYPDAELPSFEYSNSDPLVLILVYRSQRPFADLAEGLIRGAISHFNESISLCRIDYPSQQGVHSRFTLTKTFDDNA